jgi:hypothetical protein
MSSVRPFFGVDALRELKRLMAAFEAQGLDRTDLAFQMAKHAMAAYIQHHHQRGLVLPPELDFIRGLSAAPVPSALGGGSGS